MIAVVVVLVVVSIVAYAVGALVAGGGQQQRADEAYLAGWRHGLEVATPKRDDAP